MWSRLYYIIWFMIAFENDNDWIWRHSFLNKLIIITVQETIKMNFNNINFITHMLIEHNSRCGILNNRRFRISTGNFFSLYFSIWLQWLYLFLVYVTASGPCPEISYLFEGASRGLAAETEKFPSYFRLRRWRGSLHVREPHDSSKITTYHGTSR